MILNGFKNGMDKAQKIFLLTVRLLELELWKPEGLQTENFGRFRICGSDGFMVL